MQVALRVLPEPLSATAPQPPMVVAPSVKLMVPAGALPVTCALNVTAAPAIDGFAELERTVVVAVRITTCDKAALLDAPLPPSPMYAATTLWVPEASAAVAQVAVRVLPAPVSATGAQPAMVVPPSVKFTVPVGALPVTEAVKVTLVPTFDGLAELETVAPEAALLTTCDSAVLLETALPLSPVYAAMMLWVPAASAAAVHVAMRVLPVPVSVAAAQPAMVVPPSVKLTAPVGALPVTEAVKVMLVPMGDGLAELETVVPETGLFRTCASAVLLDATLLLSPE